MTDLLTGMRAKSAIVFDFETTGMPEEEHAEVIELGRYFYDFETDTIGDPWSSLARPSGPIPVVARAVHHIRDDEVSDVGPLALCWADFWEGAHEETICVAHNADFEKHFHKGNGRPWVCTYKSARVVWPDAPSHSNQALRYYLRLDDAPDFDRQDAMPPHRALPDAYVTAHIFRALLKMRSIDDLIHISKHPALLKRIAFGKHKGIEYAEAPGDYLRWIIDKSDLDKDVKFSARYWLKIRERGEAA